MKLTVGSFPAFFEAVRGVTPFRWQTRLLDSVVSRGRWPDLIDAPTGSGKSSVVDVHVFANALAALGLGPRVPRRLAVVVNRRAIVDSHSDRAEILANALDAADAGIVLRVADALRSLSGSQEALITTSIRGGLPTDRTWVDKPAATIVIAATPDMWGSRVLFRGYGTSRLARPREAGLLAVDSVVLVDEAHLSRQLVCTAQGTAHLTARHGPAIGSVPTLQVVSTTATPPTADDAKSRVTVGVTQEDLDIGDAALSTRLTAPKRLRFFATSETSDKGAARARYASIIADEARALASRAHEAGNHRTILAVVNRPVTAAHVADALVKQVGEGRVECWVGRMRPFDLDEQRRRKPGLFTIDGDDETDFLVATQTVEVGIDIDCGGLVTELAPGSALAQRFGRVNRLGLATESEVCVVVPEAQIRADRPPYRAADLTAASEWLERIGEGGDASPWALRGLPPPDEGARRLLPTDIFPGDVDLLARTSHDLFEEPQLEFWLRDDLDRSPDPVGIVLRDLPRDDVSALALVRATPPSAREAFPALLWDARAVVGRILDGKVLPRAFVWRDDEATRLDAAAVIRPGDVVILDPHSVTLRGVVVADPPSTPEPHELLWGDRDTHVVFDDRHEGDGADVDGLCRLLAGESPEVAQQIYERIGERNGASDEVKRQQVVLPPDGVTTDRGHLPWVVLRPGSSVLGEEGARQEWSPSSIRHQPVLLDAHQEAVATRAEQLGHGIGLLDELAVSLRRAGEHHDDGKADRLFQRQLREGSSVELLGKTRDLLAKSVGRNAQQVRRRSASRPGWRHEQLSAVHAQIALDDDEHRDLVVRLAGTSHGYGRPFFPRGANRLLDGNYGGRIERVAQDLFETGSGWSDVLEATDDRYGRWGVAYLEALLRAADCQVSREGS